MRVLISKVLKEKASADFVDDLLARYGISIAGKTSPDQLNILKEALSKLPEELVKRCGIKSLKFEDMGPSKEYYPNHGYYIDVGSILALNSRLNEDPHIYKDDSGRTMNRFEQTLYHELGHGFDHEEGELSEKEEWLKLSGWSKTPKKGLSRIVIEEKGSPKLEGEWYYDPSAGFSRYYGKRNPWDDFADSFSFFVAGARSFLPQNKVSYFDEKTKKYYPSPRDASVKDRGNTMHIISRTLNDLATAYESKGEIRLALELRGIRDDIRTAEENPDIARDIGKILQEKDKNGIPTLFYLLKSTELTPEIKKELKSLAPNALKSTVDLETALKLCRQASEELVKLADESKDDFYLSRRLKRLSMYAEEGKSSIANRIKNALTPTQIEMKKQEIEEKALPRKMETYIGDLKNQAQILLRTKGEDGLKGFMKSFKSLMEIKNKMENPRDPVVRTPVGPSKGQVLNPQVKKIKEDVKEEKKEDAKPQSFKEKMLEKARGVRDRFNKKPDESKKPENKAEVKISPEKPSDEKKEDTKKAEPGTKKPETKPEEKTPEKAKDKSEDKKDPDDWEKRKKEKIKGKNWDTNYTWEDFAKLSSEEQKEVVAYFDTTAERLSSFGQKDYAKQLDLITNGLEEVSRRK